MLTAIQARKNADSGKDSIVRGRVAAFSKSINNMIERASNRGEFRLVYEIRGSHSFTVADKIRDKFLKLKFQVSHRSGTDYEELAFIW